MHAVYDLTYLWYIPQFDVRSTAQKQQNTLICDQHNTTNNKCLLFFSGPSSGTSITPPLPGLCLEESHLIQSAILTVATLQTESLLNMVAPLYLVIQYARFQLSAVYRDPGGKL
jgi:hypothetical protein